MRVKSKKVGVYRGNGRASRQLKKSIPSKVWRTISGTSAESIAFIFHAQPGLAVPQGFFSSLLGRSFALNEENSAEPG